MMTTRRGAGATSAGATAGIGGVCGAGAGAGAFFDAVSLARSALRGPRTTTTQATAASTPADAIATPRRFIAPSSVASLMGKRQRLSEVRAGLEHASARRSVAECNRAKLARVAV